LSLSCFFFEKKGKERYKTHHLRVFVVKTPSLKNYDEGGTIFFFTTSAKGRYDPWRQGPSWALPMTRNIFSHTLYLIKDSIFRSFLK